MTYYETLDELPLFCWDKFMQTEDNNWFIVGYNGKQEKVQNEILTELAIKLKDDYFAKSGGDIFAKKLQKYAKRDYLMLKYETIKSIIELMTNEATIDNMEIRFFCIQQLKKFRFNIPEINTQDGDIEEINNVIAQTEGIITQINILTDELKTEGVKGNLTKELLLVSMGLELNYRIDPKVTTVSEWLEMINLLQEKNDRMKNN